MAWRTASEVLDFKDSYIGRYDYVSGYCNFHASFILENLIPLCHLEGASPQEKIEGIAKVVIAERLQGKVLLTGSGAEGLYVPKFHSLGGGTSGIRAPTESFIADLDMMYLVQGVTVQDQASTYPNADVELDLNGCHPGYVRLSLLKDSLDVPEVEESTPGESCSLTFEGKTYLDSSKFQFNMYHEREDYTPPRGTTVDNVIFAHGPAVSSERTFHTSSLQFKQTLSMDLVASIPCLLWPKAASSWTTRRRPCGWPSQAVISSVVSAGCHVVPAAHPSSTVRDIEWRLSFSAAELALARTLTVHQRRCYMLLKLICQEALVPRKVIPSYYLKTIMFWCCEQYPKVFWEKEDLFTILITLLDKLHHCLSRGYLPHYFIPQNNLLSHIPRHIVLDLQQSLLTARIDPLRVLFKFNDNMITESSRYPWDFTFKEVIHDMQVQAVNPGLMNTLKACGYSLHKMGFLNIMDNNYKLAESAFIQMSPVMAIFSGVLDKDPLDFMSKQALLMPELLPKDAVLTFASCLRYFYWYLFKSYTDPQQQLLLERDCGRLQLCLSSMRRLYAAEAQKELSDLDKDDDPDDDIHHIFSKDSKKVAKHMLMEAMKTANKEDSSPVLCDLALLHLLAGEYHKARQYAAEVVEKENVIEFPSWNIYGMLECCLFEDLVSQFLPFSSPDSSCPSMDKVIHSTGQAVAPSIMVALLILVIVDIKVPTGDLELHLAEIIEVASETEGPACQVVLEMAILCSKNAD